jgi:D-alanyl-D-alanine carboxypeptidase/D-alanyl-D-alanine-endopeptidase (penicillin-binding protein 4)
MTEEQTPHSVSYGPLAIEMPAGGRLPLSLLLLAGPALATRLERALDKVLDTPLLEGSSYGIVVWDGAGEERYARDPDRRLIPASTTKWITAAAAAHTLGLDHRFSTTIAARGYTQGDVLYGDLVVAGGGDPSLGERDPRELLQLVVDVVRAHGIARIEGTVLVDDSAFVGPPYGPGWMWDDFGSPFSPSYGAVNFAHNLLQPGLRCEAHDGPGSPLIDPPECLANSLRDALVSARISVDGAGVGSAPEAAELAVLVSPPLRELLHKMLLESDNLYAECIARALDRQRPSEPGVANEAVRELLRAAGVPEGEARFVDGSGLSRYSFASAESLVQVTAWVAAQPYGGELLALLPVAGRDGTMAKRMVGTPAEGRCAAKTGSMTGVRNLVGRVTTEEGDPLWFAVLLNGFAAPQAEAIALQDRLVAVIAASDGRKVPRRVWLAQMPPQS